MKFLTTNFRNRLNALQAATEGQWCVLPLTRCSPCYHRSMPSAHHFPQPWTIDEANNACFIVRDNTAQAIGYFHLYVPKPPLRVGYLSSRFHISRENAGRCDLHGEYRSEKLRQESAERHADEQH